MQKSPVSKFFSTKIPFNDYLIIPVLYSVTEREVMDMYATILKKDLKRKKTINFILLLFVILSAMFAASGVNNIGSVAGGIDYYFDKAGLDDYFMLTNNTADGLDEALGSSEYVESYSKEPYLSVNSNNIKKDGKVYDEEMNIGFINSADMLAINYFDKNDNVITEVEKGKFYVPVSATKRKGLEIGDKLELCIGERTLELEYAGPLKDALFGSDFMGNPRFLLNDEDYRYLEEGVKEADIFRTDAGNIYYVRTDSPKEIPGVTAGISGISFSGDKTTIKTTNMLNIMIAAIMLSVSICLLIVAFVLLRFTISFTLTEEFREIGVMKALGLKNSSIRSLYLVKYFGIAITGSIIGYFASIPFGKLLLSESSKTMVLGNSNSVLIGIVSALAVVLITLAFCWGCTGRIKKLSPIDAVRSGQTGERFRRKGIISLNRSKMKAGSFLPLNDVLSAPRTYIMITVILAICMVIIMMLATVVNTLRDDGLIQLINCQKSDLFTEYKLESNKFAADENAVDDTINEIETILADNGMAADVSASIGYRYPVESDDKKINIIFFQNKGRHISDMELTDGTSPQNAHELILTQQICDELNVDIGDKVKLTISGDTEDYLITGKYASMSQLGEVGMLHEDAELCYTDICQSMGFEINFKDHPDEKTALERKQKVKDILDADAYTTGEYVDYCTNAASSMEAVKYLVMIISAVIIALISILMERTFISKEKSEIALMKAIGFRNSSVTSHHSLRFLICGIAAAILAGIICMPLTNLIMTPIFGIMGAGRSINYKVRPLEIFCFYPCIMMAITFIGSTLTALYTKTIKACDTADIE